MLLGSVKPVTTGGNYEYLTLFINLQRGHSEMREGNSVIEEDVGGEVILPTED
jgi:hypothetical protein